MLCWKLCITKISHQTNLCSCSGEMFQRALHCTESTATMTVCLSGERKTRQRPEKLVQLETTPSTHWSPPASLNLEENIASQTGQPGVQVLLYRRWPQKQSKMLITDYTGATRPAAHQADCAVQWLQISGMLWLRREEGKRGQVKQTFHQNTEIAHCNCCPPSHQYRVIVEIGTVCSIFLYLEFLKHQI